MEKPSYTLEFEKPLRELSAQLDQLKQQSLESNVDVTSEVAAIERKIAATQREIYSNLTSWQRVQIARHPKRPYALDYVAEICEDFREMHGDRQFNDDRALVGGTAFFQGKAVMIIAQHKGRDTKEKVARNFGMPQPEGYRKALRLMKTAEKFGLPVLTFIDTPGAYPGLSSEERHVSEAIAVNLREMAVLDVPIIVVVHGEGGSGGALGIAVGDRILMHEFAVYSVIPPEGCAALLWRDTNRKVQAAEALKITAPDLLGLGIIDEIVKEPAGGAHTDPAAAGQFLDVALSKALADIGALGSDERLERRYQKFRTMGRVGLIEA